MTTSDFEALIAAGHETNGVEFKGPGLRTDDAYLAKVVRAVLGMANRRDGGFVILGVKNNGEVAGLDIDQMKTWENYDVTSEAINKYCAPKVIIDLDVVEYRGKTSIVLRVQEFKDIPIICIRKLQPSAEKTPVLREGALYVRSGHKPETAEIPSVEELRELLELAVDKGLRKFVERARKAGLYLSSRRPVEGPTDEERFDEQLEEFQ